MAPVLFSMDLTPRMMQGWLQGQDLHTWIPTHAP